LNFKEINPKEIQEKIGIAKGDKLILDLRDTKKSTQEVKI